MNQEQLLGKIDTALEELYKDLLSGKSEKLKNYLKFLGNFHRYSIGNFILIFSQNPGATYVAGYHKWLKIKRFVRKGEKGIRILAPLVKKVEPEAPDEPEKKVIFGYKVTTVFDVSQTDGEDLPEFEEGRYQGDVGENLQLLEKFAISKGVNVLWAKPSGGALGVSKGGLIIVDPELGSAEKFSTLAHEIAHELLHQGERRKETDKTLRETEAEAVAFAVCAAVGISGKDFSSDYIQLHGGNAEQLKNSLECIRTVSSEMLSALVTKSQAEVLA